MQFKKSPVVFDEASHTYYLGEKRLLGITGLIHSILGLGVYPEANEYVKEYAIPRAGSRGTAVHHAIQTYDELGVRQTTQIVPTRYGSKEVDETWDVSAELDAYIRHLDGFEPLANELTVSDNIRYASQIDNVWLYKKTRGIWLADTKTNNLRLYPLCGYFKPDYFGTSEDALREYLSWQLSVYAELFEAENPGVKVEGLCANWLRPDDDAFWVIDRKPAALVRELLSTEYVIGDNGPIYYHHDLSVFGIQSDLPMPAPDDKPVIAPQEVIDYIARLLDTERETKARLDEAKKTIREAMEKNGIKSWDSGSFKATIAVDSERATFDAARFKADHPELYKQYTIRKTAKGGFTLK